MSDALKERLTTQDPDLRAANVRRYVTRENLALAYGLIAVFGVGAIAAFFSVHRGGYFPQQWFWGVSAISILLGISILVPGYYSALSRKQWALVGALGVFVAVVAGSILWSVSYELSLREALRTGMYAGAFVLLLPAARRWSSLIVDTVVFAALLPPALYGLLQKIYPTLTLYTGFDSLESDPRASSTLGYHPSFGMICAMGALLAVSRVGSLRPSYGAIPVRALYSAVSVLFLAALYFSFSRGAVLALIGGVLVLLALSKRRFEVLGNLAIAGAVFMWLYSRIQELPGLFIRPVSYKMMKVDGWLLVEPLLKALLAAFLAQVVFSLLIRLFEEFTPRNVRRGARVIATLAIAVLFMAGIAQAWTAFQGMGGVEGVKSQLTAGDVYTDPDIARDTSQRYTSMDASARFELWEIALENWWRHPFTGTGADTYQVVYVQERAEGSGDVLHPHSMWVRILSDTGIVAFLSYAAFAIGLLALAAYNVFSITRSRRGRALVAGGAAAATAYLISSSIDWNWFIPAATLPFFVVASVAAGRVRREKGVGRREWTQNIEKGDQL